MSNFTVEGCVLNIYADDVIIYTSATSEDELKYRLQVIIDNIFNWYSMNKLCLTKKKSNVMVIGSPLRWSIRDHNIICRKVCYISITLRPRSFHNLMLLLLYTLWNVQHLLLKNQCRRYSRDKMVHLQALTMKYECFTCLFTYIATMILCSWDTVN